MVNAIESILNPNPCIEPYYPMGKPNKTFEIYRGGLKLTNKGVNISGKGKIFVKWAPIPETWFELQYCDKCGLESGRSKPIII